MNSIRFLFRDAGGSQVWYEAISVIEYLGRLSSRGESDGHYICDIKDKTSNSWFRTNDDSTPAQIRSSEVSEKGYAGLIKRV
jgi:hypothetical protein